jgi:hypothetical protein
MAELMSKTWVAKQMNLQANMLAADAGWRVMADPR